MYDATAITSVLEADTVRYERREAEKSGGNGLQMGHDNERPYQLEGPEEKGGELEGSRGQGGQQGERNEGPNGLDEQIWSADWLSGPSGPSGPRAPRPSAACRVNLSAAFEAVEAEWSAAAATALRLDS